MSYYPPISIKHAIEKIEHNQYLLPAIQREFVWSTVKIELLFDSLMRNYPIGSLLMWRVQGSNKTDHRYYSILKHYRAKFKTHCEEVNTNHLPDFDAVLDGQQRLTALYIGLKGSYAYKVKNLMWKNTQRVLPTRKLYLCLSEDSIDDDHNEDGRVYDFRFLTKQDLDNSDKIWFEVERILSLSGTYELNKFLKEQGWDANEFISNQVSMLFDVVHVKPLINYYMELKQDYDKALNIFIRINSGGEKLSYSDLIMSTIIAGWGSSDVSAREEFNGLIDEVWSSTGIDLNKDLIIRSYLLIFSDDIKFRVTNFSLENAKEFQDNWPGIRAAIIEAIELVRDFGYVERTLIAKNALLPIVHYLFVSKRTEQFRTRVAYRDDRELIKKWLHVVLLKRIFGGQADNVLKIIRNVIAVSVRNNAPAFPAKEVATRLSKTRKSLSMDAEEIDNLLHTTYENRYAFSILAILYPHLDYKNGDFHKDHIHPKSLFNRKALLETGIKLDQENAYYYTDNAINNGIVNLQLLDGNENMSKGDKTLQQWVEDSNVDFNKQILPSQTGLNEFIPFVDQRWVMLRERLQQALSFNN
jgi:uncharacterized protein with ParB-like and HNH nuclease domain